MSSLSLMSSLKTQTIKPRNLRREGNMVTQKVRADSFIRINRKSMTMNLGDEVEKMRDRSRKMTDNHYMHILEGHKEQFEQNLVDKHFARPVLYTNSGPKALETAVELSRNYRIRHSPLEGNEKIEFIAFKNSFHQALLVKNNLIKNEEVTFLDFGDKEATNNLMKSGKITTVFVEPFRVEQNDYLPFLRRACDDSEALLVFDEIECGFGRTGSLWAHEAHGIYPDMMTIAVPEWVEGPTFGALLMSKSFAMRNYYDFSPETFLVADPLLKQVSDPKFFSNVVEKGRYFKYLLEEKIEKESHVTKIWGLGLILEIELDVPEALTFIKACEKSMLSFSSKNENYVVSVVLNPNLISNIDKLKDEIDILFNASIVLDDL